MSSLTLVESILLEADSSLLWGLYEQNDKETPEGINIYNNTCVVNLIKNKRNQEKKEEVKKDLSRVIWPRRAEDPVIGTKEAKKYDKELIVIACGLDFYKERIQK